MPEPISHPMETRRELRVELTEALEKLWATNTKSLGISNQLDKLQREWRELQRERLADLEKVDQARQAYRRTLESKQDILSNMGKHFKNV